MSHLHRKIKKGRPYYYIREIKRVDGKPKVVSQIYSGSRRSPRGIFLLRLGQPAHQSEKQTRPSGLVPGHRGLRDQAGADRGTLLATVLGEMGTGVSGRGGGDRERVLRPAGGAGARPPGGSFLRP